MSLISFYSRQTNKPLGDNRLECILEFLYKESQMLSLELDSHALNDLEKYGDLEDSKQ